MSLYRFAVGVLTVLTAILYKLKVEGVENLESDKGFILACNHVTCYDPIFLGIAAYKQKRQINYMAKEELIKAKFTGSILRKLGAFPVRRGKGDTDAIDTAVSIVGSGEILGIFPEGTRSKTGEPQKGKSGVALISNKTGADILPAAIIIQNKKLRFRSRVTVRFGDVIKNEELNFSADAIVTSELKDASRLVMDKITELWNMGV